MDQYSRVHAQLTIGVVFLMVISACSASRNTYAVQSQNQKSNPNQAVINVAPSNLAKDAIRLQGILLSDIGKKGGWYQYGFQVKRTIKYGSTFASIEPSDNEEIILNTSEKLDYQANALIIVDVTTPRERSAGRLMVFKVSEE